ncbi:Outer membrane protein beta-barrel family protein [Nonlabens sp. Hel1_33_55]|uniref:carboxypeptidase regulatory-like domain-containing protein n=1 Tax=Nonlabens sp. Hel1_33_55 TaxID=1336802 RepID=UPI000875AAE3|nr:carboxypeptidase regulatory-like domain-containing protein [Nonlabens sp. Hel1_33_55]SCY27119.1 Outer membrane protein beta-barrel family protein [Nonlabens sp. Hel1_33_55]
MNKILLLITGMFLMAIAANAQSVKITGVVVDSLGTPVPMANVIAYGSNNTLGAFGITNTEGRYQLLNLKQDSTYVLKVSFLGLKPIEETVTKIQSDMTKNFIMLDGADQLDAISIVYEMPVTIKGDTIVYNSDSFTNGTERRLEDVLKKLPGMEVSEDGDVQVEGKAVERVFINGKEFFEGDTRLATKNIPADAISKVEVLKNFNNVSQLKGVGNDQDRVAINIRLKEGKEKFWFGEITAAGGYGNDDVRYQVKPKAFYYSPDLSVNILTDFNNLGIPAFSFRDYARFTGRSFSNTSDAGSNVGTGVGTSGFTTFRQNQAVNIESKFAAFNAAFKASESLDISGFAIFSKTRTDDSTIQNRLYADVPDDGLEGGIQEDIRDVSFQENDLAIFKLGADYKPNSNLTLDYNGQINITDVTETSNFVSSRIEPVENGGTENVVENIGQLDSQRPVVIDQSLNGYYTAGDRSIFSLESRYINQEEDPFYNAIRDIQNQQDPEPFNGRLGLTQADPYNINQNNLVQTSRLDAKVDYWYILNKISNLNVTVGGIFAQQDYNSSIFQILDNQSRNDLTDSDLVNDVQYNYNDVYAGLHYKVITGKFTITPGFNYHSISTKDEQNGSTNEIKTNRILPDLDIRFDLKSSESLSFNYNETLTFSDVNNYAQALVFGNYNSLSSGNNQLEGAINDAFRINYRNFNMFNYTTIFGGLNYTKQRDAIQNSFTPDGINQISTPINSQFAQESFGGNGRFSREFGKINASVGASMNFSSFNNVNRGQNQELKNFTQTYSAGLRSNWDDGVNFDLNYSLNLQNVDQGLQVTNFTTNTFSIDADWQIGEALQLVAEYDLNLFSGDLTNQNYDFLETSLYYNKPDSKWEYKVAATNLTNTQAIVSASAGGGFIVSSTTQNFVLPRYVYLQVKYDL